MSDAAKRQDLPERGVGAYSDSRIPDFITGKPQVFFWRIGMRRTGNAISALRWWLWRIGGGTI